MTRLCIVREKVEFCPNRRCRPINSFAFIELNVKIIETGQCLYFSVMQLNSSPNTWILGIWYLITCLSVFMIRIVTGVTITII